MSHLLIATIDRGGAEPSGKCAAATPSHSRIGPSIRRCVRSSTAVDSHF
jgi:hypothetical protein